MEKQNFIVLQLNCYCFSSLIYRVTDAIGLNLHSRVCLPTPERIRAIADYVRKLNPDVVCFQELWKRRNKLMMSALLADILPDATEDGSSGCCFGFGVDSGLLTLSKAYVRDSQVYHYRHKGKGDGLLAQKGFTRSDIEWAGGETITVINTHTTGRVAREQMRELMGKIGLQQNPTMLCGDLNTKVYGDEKGWDSEPLNQLDLGQIGLQSHLDLVAPGHGSNYHDDPPNVIDHVVSTVQPVSVRIDRTPIENRWTDHAAVISSFRL